MLLPTWVLILWSTAHSSHTQECPSSPLSFHIQLRSLETHCFLPRTLPSPQCQSLSQETQSYILVISDPLPLVCGCHSCSCLTWALPRPGQGMGSSLFCVSATPLPVLGQRGPAWLSKAVAIISGWIHTYFRQITSSFEQWFSHLRVHYKHLQGWLNAAFSTFLLSPQQGFLIQWVWVFHHLHYQIHSWSQVSRWCWWGHCILV